MNVTTTDIKEHYDVAVPKSSGNEYEYNRWFKNAEMVAGYDMTKRSIERVLQKTMFTTCFELGPGPGTWTKLLCTHTPNARIDVLDISGHMLSMAKEALRDVCSNITFTQSDFLQFEPKAQYDFFFSSRAFEYLSEKEQAVQVIEQLLISGGSGAIITKYPRYAGFKLRGKEIPAMHKLQIFPEEMRTALENAGLKVKEIRPAVLTFPFFRSALLHRSVYALLGRFRFNAIHRLFCESYIVTFEKS